MCDIMFVRCVFVWMKLCNCDQIKTSMGAVGVTNAAINATCVRFNGAPLHKLHWLVCFSFHQLSQILHLHCVVFIIQMKSWGGRGVYKVHKQGVSASTAPLLCDHPLRSSPTIAVTALVTTWYVGQWYTQVPWKDHLNPLTPIPPTGWYIILEQTILWGLVLCLGQY